MTDRSSAQATVRRPKLAWLGSAWLNVGASFSAISSLIGDAFSMAYVHPYSGLRRREPVPDDDLKSRDPAW